MMILVDTGPLIALTSAEDQHHAACASVIKTIRPPLGTVWPVLTEAMYLLNGLPRAQHDIWEMLARGALELLPLGRDDVPRIRELMKKYASRPMDLADAALIRVAERDGLRQFFTVDRKDFSVYRLHDRIRPSILP
jgi:predicted nucleic acid-binding protein